MIISFHRKTNYILKDTDAPWEPLRARFCSLQPRGSAQPTVIDTPIQTFFSLAKSEPVRKHTHKHVCHLLWALAGTAYIFLSPSHSLFLSLSLFLSFSLSLFLSLSAPSISGVLIHIALSSDQHLYIWLLWGCIHLQHVIEAYLS